MEISNPDGTGSDGHAGGAGRLTTGPAGRVADDAARTCRDRAAHALLLLVAIVAVWFPTQTRPLTAVVIAAAGLALCTWGWKRSRRESIQGMAGGGAVLLVLGISAASGWDPSRAVGEIGLVAAGLTLVWLASRSRAPRSFPFLLALGLSGLALWGLWQTIAGLDALRHGLEALPDAARVYAEERLASRRAYASLPLPSHLAVILATALPLLVARVRATPTGVIAALGALVSAVGLLATRSPVGVALALAACTALVIGRFRRSAIVAALVSAVILIAVIALRPDVSRLEPVSLRIDNWRTALWLASTSPWSGSGFSSFAQASQALPLEVGNRPAHAHDLPLEILAELGPAGFVGCLALAFWFVRLVVRLWPLDRALAAALVVVPLHNLVDFSFFVSAVAIPWAVLVGWGIERSRDPRGATEPNHGRIVAVTLAVAAVAMASLHATSAVVEEAAAAQPAVADRFDGALRSLRLAPWRVEPQFLLAAAALESADRSLCDRAFSEMDERRWVRPRSAALAERRARLALVRGDVSVAIAELRAAVELGSPDARRELALRELLGHLEGRVDDPPV